jgi:hypothetical protein
MARIFPDLSEAQLQEIPSGAEARLYRACRDGLDGRLLVLYSVRYVRRSQQGALVDREADFILFDPSSGFLVIEVKGGRISRSNRKWFSVDGANQRHEIKDPVRQATEQKYAVLQRLKGRLGRRGPQDQLLTGHAVFFPDCARVTPLIEGDLHEEMIGGKNDLAHLQAWFDRAMLYWKGADTRFAPLGEAGLRAVEELYCKPVEVRPLMAVQLQDEETQRIRLTEDQASILRTIGGRRQALVCGGAGTGKTMLALEQGRRFAAGGQRTLLLCFNRALADHLKAAVGNNSLLLPMNFHQLCEWRARLAQLQAHRDVLQQAHEAHPGASYYDTILPHALALSTEVLADSFEACIVDEAQDFHVDYWLPLKLLLARSNKPTLHIFFDQNQAVYRTSQQWPIQEEPLLLWKNCRNSRFIHEVAYRYFRGDSTEPCAIEGAPVELLAAPGRKEQALRIHETVSRLLQTEHVPPREIAVLVADNMAKKGYYELVESLPPLPGGVTWVRETHRVEGTLLIDTVHRYKGLEAGIILLWGFDHLEPDADREIIYVGLSRAKSRLYLVGQEASCHRLLSPRLT